MPTPKPQPAVDERKIERWTAQRKAAIIVYVLKVKISVPEACRKYGFTQGEYRECADEFMRGGINAFKFNRKGEALRIIPLDESERWSIDSLRSTSLTIACRRSTTSSRNASSI